MLGAARIASFSVGELQRHLVLSKSCAMGAAARLGCVSGEAGGLV